MKINSNYKFKRNYQGFTLIELLVVIAIIGILATISVLALNSTRSRARDAKRLNDVSQVATALEMYYNDHNEYPYCTGDSGSESSGWYTCLQPALSLYMKKLPQDPLYKGKGYAYYSNMTNRGQTVTLSFFQENPNPNLSNAYFSWYMGNGYGYIYSWRFGDY